METPRFVVEPHEIIQARPDLAQAGQDVIEIRPGELWMFTHWSPGPMNTNPTDPHFTQAPVLKSYDGGRSWGQETAMPLPYTLDGCLQGGGRSVLRLRSGRIVFAAHRAGTKHARSGGHGTPLVSVSDDSGDSWSPARLIVEEDDISYVMNQRLIQMDTGRLVLPAEGCDPRVPLAEYREGVAPNNGYSYLSDDEGLHWRKGVGMVLDSTERGVQESCVAQVGPDRLYLIYRSGRGYHMGCFSEDGGDTWSDPQLTSLQAACSPLTLTTLPDSRLMLVFDCAKPLFPGAYFPRRPLCYSLSVDGGASWSDPVLIDDRQNRQFGYPSVTPFDEGILVTYSVHYDPGDGSFAPGPSWPEDYWRYGGTWCCAVEYPR